MFCAQNELNTNCSKYFSELVSWKLGGDMPAVIQRCQILTWFILTIEE